MSGPCTRIEFVVAIALTSCAMREQHGRVVERRDAGAALEVGAQIVDLAGGDPEGRIDSTAALQAANNMIEATGKPGAIRLRGGTYLACLTLGPNVSLEGAGINVTRIRMPPGANCSAVISTRGFTELTGGASTGGAFRNHVRDLTIDGNRQANRLGRGVQIYGKAFQLEGLSIESAAQEGLYTEYGGADDFTSAGGTLEACIRDLSIQQNGGTGWIDIGPHDQIVDGVVVFNNGAWGWDLRTSANASKVNAFLNRLGGIHVWTSTGRAGQVGTIYGANITGSTASGWGALFETGGSTISSGSFGGPVGLEVRANHNQIHGVIANTSVSGLKLNGALASGSFDLIYGGNNTGVWVDASVASSIPSMIRISSGDGGGTLFNRGPTAIPLGITEVAALGKTGTYTREAMFVGASYRTSARKARPLQSGKFTIIDYDAREYDTARAVTTGERWHFSAPVAGKYYVLAQSGFERAGVGVSMSIFVNGVEVQRSSASRTGSSGGTCAVQGILSLGASDSVDIRARADGGGAALSQAQVTNTFSVVRIPASW